MLVVFADWEVPGGVRRLGFPGSQEVAVNRAMGVEILKVEVVILADPVLRLLRVAELLNVAALLEIVGNRKMKVGILRVLTLVLLGSRLPDLRMLKVVDLLRFAASWGIVVNQRTRVGVSKGAAVTVFDLVSQLPILGVLGFAG